MQWIRAQAARRLLVGITCGLVVLFGLVAGKRIESWIVPCVVRRPRDRRSLFTADLVLALAALLAAPACARQQAPPPPPMVVLVVPVVQKDVPVVGEWIGTLDGSVNADIRPKVEGYLLRQFYKEGQFVQRNAADLARAGRRPGRCLHDGQAGQRSS